MKPYKLKSLTIIFSDGHRVPMEIVRSEDIRYTDRQLRHLLREQFRSMNMNIVDVEYVKE